MQFLIPPQHKTAAGVYAIRSTVDSRIYVGSTLNFLARHSSHKSTLGRNEHRTTRLQDFVSEHGLNCLSFELLEVADTDQDLYALEQKWLDITGAHCPELGFNSNPRAAGVPKLATASKRGVRPLMRVECVDKNQKALFDLVADRRGIATAALVRLLLLDEARRLGISAPEAKQGE